MFPLVLSLCLLFTTSINAQYPEYDDEMCIGSEDGVLFGIPNECYKYYYCVEEVAYLDDCTNFCEGCQFDVNLNDCNNEEEVQCVAEEIPTYPPVTEPPAQTTTVQSQTTDDSDITCPPNEFIFLESENCTEYYICAYGNKFTMSCMDGLVWNSEEKQCDHPIYSPRCSGISTDNTNSIKCNRHGFYTTAYPYDCEKFVFCSEGIPIVILSLKNMHLHKHYSTHYFYF